MTLALPMRLLKLLSFPIILTGLSWGAFTVIIYLIIVYSGFVEMWGLNYNLTFKTLHYRIFFSVSAKVTFNGLVQLGIHFGPLLQLHLLPLL